MYEPPQLRATAIPPAIPTFVPQQHHQQRQADVDPVAIWQSFVATVLRRRTLFAGVFAAVLLTVALVTFVSPRMFTTDVKMIAGNPASVAQNPQAQTGLPVLNALMLANAAQSAETYAELIGETPVVQHVIDDLGLKTDVRTLQSAVRVKPVTNTNIISLQVTWDNPAMSAKIANDFATVFVAREAELVASSATGALEFLQKQLPEAERKLRLAEGNLSAFQTSHNIADLGAQTTSLVTAASNIDAKINAIQLEKRQADAQIGSLGGALAGMSATAGGGSSVAQNPVLPQLRGQLAALQVQLGSARQQYTDSHPQVISLKQQIADLNREIARQPATIVATTSTIANPVYQQVSQQLTAARAMSESDSAQLSQLAKQRTAINPKLAALPAQSAQMLALQREKKLAEDTYNALQQKFTDATIARTAGISDVTITQPASEALAKIGRA